MKHTEVPLGAKNAVPFLVVFALNLLITFIMTHRDEFTLGTDKYALVGVLGMKVDKTHTAYVPLYDKDTRGK